jgi:hypothetical protein
MIYLHANFNIPNSNDSLDDSIGIRIKNRYDAASILTLTKVAYVLDVLLHQVLNVRNKRSTVGWSPPVS